MALLSDSQIKKLTPARLAALKLAGSRDLPDKYLTPAQLAARGADKKRQDQIKTDALEIVPGSGLTLGSLKKQLQQQEQLQYSGTDEAYKTQGAQLAANETRDKGWFNTYRQHVLDQKQKLDDQNTTYQSANENVANTQQESSRAANQAQANQLNDASNQLNLGGLQGQDFLAKANMATDSRAQVLRAAAQAAGERAQGNSRLLDAAAIGVDANQSDALARYLSANVDLSRKKDTLNKDKAAFREKILNKAVTDADTRVQTEKVLQASVNKDAATLALAQQKANTDAKYRDSMIAIALKQLGINQQTADQKGVAKPATPAKSLRASAESVQNTANRLDRLSKVNWSRDRDKTAEKLRRTGNYSQLEIDIRADMIYKRGVSARNQQRLTAMGYKLSDFPILRKGK